MSAQKVVGAVADDGVYRRTAAGQRAAVFGAESVPPDAMRWLLMLTGLTPLRALAEIGSTLDVGREQMSALLDAGLVEPVPAEPMARRAAERWPLN